MISLKDLLGNMAEFGGMLFPAFIFWYLGIRASHGGNERKAKAYKGVAICIGILYLASWFIKR